MSSHRACTGCRSLKIKCVWNDGGLGDCERCVRFQRECVVPAVQKRRQIKTSDVRIAALEKEVETLRSALQSTEIATQSRRADLEQSNYSTDGGRAHVYEASATRTNSRSHLNASSTLSRAMQLCDSFVSISLARRLVEYYKTHMYPSYPLVYIPAECTADDLRQTRPTLLLAILAGAAGGEDPELATKLDRAILEEYANRTMLSSEKSLELVQALLISSSWYQPPTKLNQYKYSEYAHVASMMAADLGLTSRPITKGFGDVDKDMSCVDDNFNAMQSMRTVLALLLKSIGTMITSRRPATMRVTSYVHTCIDCIDKSPEATLGDSVLVAWVRLLVIADEIGNAFCYDDPDAAASVFDTKSRLMTNSFNRRLLEWKQHNFMLVDSTATLRMTYHTVRLYLHETILHVDHQPEDFKVPYRMSAVNPSRLFLHDTIPIKFAIDCLIELMKSSQAIMDAFTDSPVHETRALTLGMFVRVSYAALVMAKLCASAVDTHSPLANLIDSSVLQADVYMEKTLLHLRSAIGGTGCRVPAIFLNLLCEMRTWCANPGYTNSLHESKRTLSTNGSDFGSGHSSSDGHSTKTLVSPLALTDTFEANYERFGNEKVVKLAAIQGQVNQSVDISETLTHLEAVISLESQSRERERSEWLEDNIAGAVDGTFIPMDDAAEAVQPHHMATDWVLGDIQHTSMSELDSRDALSPDPAYMNDLNYFLEEELIEIQPR